MGGDAAPVMKHRLQGVISIQARADSPATQDSGRADTEARELTQFPYWRLQSALSPALLAGGSILWAYQSLLWTCSSRM